MIEEVNENWNMDPLDYPFGRGINLQIETSEINRIRSALKQHDITPFKDIFESVYTSDTQTFKQQGLLVQDPDGYLLRFSQDIKS